MVRLLAIDTTSATGSLALLEDNRVVEETIVAGPDGFSPVIFGEIEALLARHGWALSSIDCFAGASGPGSFTGVRVCLTTVKGLAEACGKPAIGVSNLMALASLIEGEVRAVWIDARRGEIYGAVYSASLDAIQEEVAIAQDPWLAALPTATVVFEGRKIPLAAAVGRIALSRYRHGDRPDPASVDANYVRRSDAELFWKEPSSRHSSGRL